MTTSPLPRLTALRKRSERAQALLELLETTRVAGTPLDRAYGPALEEAAVALITPLCDGQPDRARQVIDWAQRPARPRSATWLDHVIGRLAVVWAGHASEAIVRDPIPNTPSSATPVTPLMRLRMARDLLELTHLEAAAQHNVDVAAIALLTPACGSNQRAVAVVDHAHTLSPGEKTPGWLRQLIDQHVPEGQ